MFPWGERSCNNRVQLAHPVVWYGWSPRFTKHFVHCADVHVNPSAQTKLSISVVTWKRWISTCRSVKSFHLYFSLGLREQKPLQCQHSHSQPGLPGSRIADRRADSHFCSSGMVIPFAREQANSQNRQKKIWNSMCLIFHCSLTARPNPCKHCQWGVIWTWTPFEKAFWYLLVFWMPDLEANKKACGWVFCFVILA